MVSLIGTGKAFPARHARARAGKPYYHPSASALLHAPPEDTSISYPPAPPAAPWNTTYHLGHVGTLKNGGSRGEGGWMKDVIRLESRGEQIFCRRWLAAFFFLLPPLPLWRFFRWSLFILLRDVIFFLKCDRIIDTWVTSWSILFWLALSLERKKSLFCESGQTTSEGY